MPNRGVSDSVSSVLLRQDSRRCHGAEKKTCVHYGAARSPKPFSKMASRSASVLARARAAAVWSTATTDRMDGRQPESRHTQQVAKFR